MHAALDWSPPFNQRLLSRSPLYILRKINFYIKCEDFRHFFLIFSQKGVLSAISEDRKIQIGCLQSNWSLWCHVKSIIITKKYLPKETWLLVIALRWEQTISDAFFFYFSHCCMTSSNDDVMYLRSYCVTLTTLTNQEMVVTYSV